MLKLTTLAVLLTSLSIFACDIDGKTGFMPENDLNIAVDAKNANDMTEERFNEIIDKADNHYKQIVKDKGGKLKWSRKWNNGTVNASAQQTWGTWRVNMYGGLARHELVTDDAFAMVVCHELGHHLGGAPKKGGWPSNEGQSDYWATLKCFRRIYETDNNQEIVSKMDIPATVRTKCEANFKDLNDQALCMRSSMGGLSLGSLLGSLGGSGDIDFDTPSTTVVSSTNHNHPHAQCRLDTYFAGAACDKTITDLVSDTDANMGTCSRNSNYSEGIRPLCWFKPQE